MLYAEQKKWIETKINGTEKHILKLTFSVLYMRTRELH